MLGEAAFEALAGVVASVVLVSDAEIVEAQKSLWELSRMLVEPAAACGWAALVNRKLPLHAMERLVAVCCGGNVDPVQTVLQFGRR
jgi:threonine dehydratase